MEVLSTDSIVLEIQGSLLECSRTALIKNSDYFKAMFEGNFVESSKTRIPLNDIDLPSMKIILILIWDKEYIIEEENVLPVLQAASMLQFLEIKQICIDQLLGTLSPSNCLKVWVYTEHLGLIELSLKAKLLALMEFTSVKKSDYFLDLNLDETVNYLGSIYLQCLNEMEVFEAMTKWYQNVGSIENTDVIKLLHCLDFTDLTVKEIEEIINNQEIKNNQQIVHILQCTVATKNGTDTAHFREDCIAIANSLLQSKNRNKEGFPCVLVENLKVEKQESFGEGTVLYYDRYKRKRKYNVLENLSTNFCIVCIDTRMDVLKKIFDFYPQKLLDGFKIIGYKHYIYLYGGESLLGKGDWNITFYMYDIIQEKWKYVGLLPFKRRHFESCFSGDYLFVVGGTGPFRVIQENIFWYNLKSKTWSEEQRLPCSGRQIKCCSFKRKLFVLNMNNKCGYMFYPHTGKWTKHDIMDPDNVLPCYSKTMSLFSYKSSLYIKENKLYELKLQENNLIIASQIDLTAVQKAICEVESVLCKNVLYILKKQWCEDTTKQVISLESFNLDTHETFCYFQKIIDDLLEVENEIFKFAPALIIYKAFHYSLLSGNELINHTNCVE